MYSTYPNDELASKAFRLLRSGLEKGTFNLLHSHLKALYYFISFLRLPFFLTLTLRRYFCISSWFSRLNGVNTDKNSVFSGRNQREVWIVWLDRDQGPRKGMIV